MTVLLHSDWCVCSTFAPPKNKKEMVMGWSLAINRPPLRGLGNLRAKQHLSWASNAGRVAVQ